MPLTLPHHTTHHITSLHHTITYHPIHQYLSLHKPSVTPNTIHFQHSSPSWCWTFPITLTTKSKQNPAVTSPTNRNFQPLTFFFFSFSGLSCMPLISSFSHHRVNICSATRSRSSSFVILAYLASRPPSPARQGSESSTNVPTTAQVFHRSLN